MERYNFYNNGFPNYDIQFPKIERGEEYKPSEALICAVNVALMLQKPLLLTGHPGTGKSELAYHIAKHFDLGEVLFFSTRSDSVMTDLLYQYHSLAHFHNVNISGNQIALTAEYIEKQFITYVALGRAICDSVVENTKPRVVLIDEIDKAPRDLPNDILSIIETMSFEVQELKTATDTNFSYYNKGYNSINNNKIQKPVVILTSNSEKNLPEAFLRRCVFFNIEMPNQKEMMEILLAKKKIFPDLHSEEANAFINIFIIIREMVNGKKPTTYELIVWVWWMRKQGLMPSDVYNVDRESKDIDIQKRNYIIFSGISILAKEVYDLNAITDAIKYNNLPR